MRTNLLINSLIIFLALPFVCFAQDCKARINIFINAESAELIIDDTLSYRGKDFTIDLEPGKHSLLLTKNAKQWNTKIIRDTLNIEKCDTLSLTYNFTSQLIINSNPQNVYVYESDSLKGFTPLLLDDDFEKLIFKKPDYSDITLSHDEIFSGIKPELKFVGENKTESFYQSTLFKILAGTLIALGATTAYYKLEADKTFDEYQLSGDPALLEQTDKYDIISGVSFVALQINFGLILYLFLAD